MQTLGTYVQNPDKKAPPLKAPHPELSVCQGSTVLCCMLRAASSKLVEHISTKTPEARLTGSISPLKTFDPVDVHRYPYYSPTAWHSACSIRHVNSRIQMGGRKSGGICLTSRALKQPWEISVEFSSSQDSYPHILGVCLSGCVSIYAPKFVLTVRSPCAAKNSGARKGKTVVYSFLPSVAKTVCTILSELFIDFMLWQQHDWNFLKPRQRVG